MARTLLVLKIEKEAVEEIVARWAPAVENHTDAYINVVAERLGIPRFQPVKESEYARLAHAMAYVENGGDFWPLSMFEEGYRLAG